MIPADAILERVKSLPTLSTAVARLAVLFRDEHTSSADFEDVITPDPALTANLLRMANSAHLGSSRQVTSVRQAVTLIGMKRVFELATTASFVRTVPARIPGYDIDAEAYWQHCGAVAILAERLSKELRLKTPELTFTAGLLHDVGKLAIGSFLLEDSGEILDCLYGEALPFIDAEHDVLGTDHAMVGATIADEWDLPEAIGAVARWHHEPCEAASKEHQMIIDLIHAADGLAHSLGYGADIGELSREVKAGVIQRLGIKVQRLEIVACESLDQIRQVVDAFAPVSGGRG